jgi:hypothetical protein
MSKSIRLLTAFTAAWDAILAGAAWAQLLIHLPARHRIGVVAYSDYARVTDMGPGLFFYTPLAFGSLILNSVLFWLSLRGHVGRKVTMPLGAAAASSAMVLLTTTQAAPALLAVRRAPNQEEVLAPLLDRFNAWSIVRGVFLQAAFWATLWALTPVKDEGYDPEKALR